MLMAGADNSCYDECDDGAMATPSDGSEMMATQCSAVTWEEVCLFDVAPAVLARVLSLLTSKKMKSHIKQNIKELKTVQNYPDIITFNYLISVCLFLYLNKLYFYMC